MMKQADLSEPEHSVKRWTSAAVTSLEARNVTVLFAQLLAQSVAL